MTTDHHCEECDKQILVGFGLIGGSPEKTTLIFCSLACVRDWIDNREKAAVALPRIGPVLKEKSAKPRPKFRKMQLA